jgi:transglutaminase/protease-like cytokinesis protein 3
MQQLGVPTYYTVGWGGEMHAWDIIKLEDDYYNVDVTWDDQDPTMYDFFNVSDRQNVMHTRMYQSRYLPPCNGTKYSGLEKKEADLSGYNLASDEIFTDYSKYFDEGLKILKNIDWISEDDKNILYGFVEYLRKRNK